MLEPYLKKTEYYSRNDAIISVEKWCFITIMNTLLSKGSMYSGFPRSVLSSIIGCTIDLSKLMLLLARLTYYSKAPFHSGIGRPLVMDTDERMCWAADLLSHGDGQYKCSHRMVGFSAPGNKRELPFI